MGGSNSTKLNQQRVVKFISLLNLSKPIKGVLKTCITLTKWNTFKTGVSESLATTCETI